ncbi:MAG: guanylate kinase [Pseudomonadota bacterium]|jgi:guanylate kinase|nr:guanylate kinase [Pseudomonadota bacterium]QKK04877.1 MAG: guanylate kinase [Pseudomonadota bacterium]
MLPQNINRRGVMLVLSSPSGAGKTTISRRLMEEDSGISVSISATTRPKREGEIDGVHYHFVSREKFEEMIKNEEFLEHATVFGNLYGTPRKPVEEALDRGQDILFDIDWQGTQQLKAVVQGELVSIFILPPSLEELKERLEVRGQDSDEEIAFRMSRAMDEISHYGEYHYALINYDIDDSLHRVQSILEAERMKRRRLLGLSDFVRKFTEIPAQAERHVGD